MAKLSFDEETEVAEMELRKSSILRVTLVPTSDGQRVIGLREWVNGGPGKYSGPTRQGLILPPVALEALIVALKRVQKSLVEDGVSV